MDFIDKHPDWPFLRVWANRKEPAERAWKDELPTLEQVRDHIARGGNYGLCTGEGSGVLVVDYDLYKTKATFNAATGEVKDAAGNVVHTVPPTLLVQSGSGGVHAYFRYSPDLHDAWLNAKCAALLRTAGLHVDIRTGGGYILCPGSRLEAGAYTVLADRPPADMPLEYAAQFKARKPGRPRKRPQEAQPRPEPDGPTVADAPLVGAPAPNLPALAALADLERLLLALKDWRADDYDNWLHVGLILKHTVGLLGEEHDATVLQLYKAFSARSPKFVAADVEAKWRALRPNGTKTLASLFHMARSDGVRAGAAPAAAAADPLLWKYIMDPTNQSAAELAHARMPPVLVDRPSGRWFVCSTNNVWMERWPPEIQAAARAALEAALDSDLGPLAHCLRRERERCRSKLGSYQFIATTVMTLHSMCMYTPDPSTGLELTEAFDRKRHLFAYNDGFVRDYSTKPAPTLRPLLPEDMVSLTCLLPSPRTAPPSPDIVREVRAYIDSVFEGQPDKAEYFLRFVASARNGNAPRKVFLFFLGESNSGKSVLIEFVMLGFGQYALLISPAFFVTRDFAATGPAPELVEWHAVRFINMSEPEGTATWQTGKLKVCTGEKTMRRRPLRQKNQSIDIQAIFSAQCNRSCRFEVETGTVTRFRVLKFPCIFVDPENLEAAARTHQTVRPCRDLSHIMTREGAIALHAILDDIEERFAGASLQPTPSMMADTAQLMMDSCPTVLFTADCLVHQPGAPGVKKKDAFKMYREWAIKFHIRPLRLCEWTEDLTRLGFAMEQRDKVWWIQDVSMDENALNAADA